MNLYLDDEQAHNIEVALTTLQGLLQIAAERDDAETPMSMEGAQDWAHSQLVADFPLQLGALPVSSPDEHWWLSYQLAGSLPYYEPSLRSRLELRPVIAHLTEGTTGPKIRVAESWCVYWVDEIGINDWIEWFPSHAQAGNYLGRLVTAAFTGEHIDAITNERES